MTSDTRIVDAEARARAADLGASVAISAGAGSGKTSVLTSRLVALLEGGRAPREIAAITFTEKAAGELLARARDALESIGAGGAQVSDGAAPAPALARFGELTISTIHAFCRELLLRESLEADFAPDTDIGADTDFIESIVVDTLRTWRGGLRARRPDLRAVVDQLVTDHWLRTGAQHLYRHRDYFDVARKHPFHPARAREELRAVLAELREAAKACCDADDKLLASNAAVVDAADNGVHGADLAQAVLEAMLSPAQPSRVGGRAEDWGGKSAGKDAKQRYINAAEAFAQWRTRWREHAHGEVVRDLREHFLPLLDARKRQASLATFDDLLVDAARLLRTRPAARARLAQRYRYVLVDEVQDTDPVQAEVAALLTANASDVAEQLEEWTRSTPAAGRLFAVGDVKQSIYRFRGADVDAFKRLESVIVRQGERASLTQNFRSVPGVVAWVNTAFAALPHYEKQTAHRAPAELDPVVVLEATDLVSEADAVARHLRDLFDRQARVIDPKTRELRVIEAGDVMLLLPAWSQADPIADTLRRAGFECVVEGGDTFFERDEVRLGMAALRALVEPADTEATVFLLRGVFGCSLEELAQHAAPREKRDAKGNLTIKSGSFRYTVPDQPAGRVAECLSVLARLYRGRAHRSLASLLDELFDATRVTAAWSVLPDGKSRLANLDKLASMVRAAEGATTSPLGAVEELLRIERNVQNKDISRIDDDDNAIRVTSLFKAKGLEAPLVVLLAATRKADGVERVVDHDVRALALRLGELEPPDWLQLKRREIDQENHERRRWMYVACTRARDQLVICRAPAKAIKSARPSDSIGAGGAQGSYRVVSDLFSADVGGALPKRGHDYADDEIVEVHDGAARVRVRRADALAPVARSAETFPALDAHVDSALANPASGDGAGDAVGAAFASKRKDELRASTRRCVRWRAASGAEANAKQPWQPGVAVASDARADDVGALSQSVGARGGRVIHAVMERLDLARPHDELVVRGRELTALLGRQAGIGDELVEKCQRIVERILAHPLVDKARAAPERWPEVPFTYEPRAGSVVSGTIDLCFPLDATRREWAVFDWKSRVPAQGDPLRAKYEEQLRKYAQALLANLGDVKIAHLEIIGPYPELGEQASAEDALTDVRGDLRSRLAELIERGAPVPDVINEELVGVGGVDLAWTQRRLAVLVDATAEQFAALSMAGWIVKRALDDDVAALLGAADAAKSDQGESDASE